MPDCDICIAANVIYRSEDFHANGVTMKYMLSFYRLVIKPASISIRLKRRASAPSAQP